MTNNGLKGTFALNKKEAIHRWFSYIEGYSDSLVEKELELIGYNNIQTLYDPFGGSGTSLLTASKHNIIPYYSEINPVMSFICATKINCSKHIKNVKNKMALLLSHKEYIKGYSFAKTTVNDYQGFEKYYNDDQLSVLLQLLNIIENISDLDVQNVCKVALASIVVRVSKMIRRGDLRYAKDNEKKNINQNVQDVYLEKLGEIIDDLLDNDIVLYTEVTKLSEDSRDIQATNLFDCVITSPPYLNGTNYIRNTKLELKMLKFVNSEKDLPTLHSKGIIAGINSVSKRSTIEILPIVESYVEKLAPITYDKRIPRMIAGYFYDMNKVLEKLSVSIKPGGYFIMDIGDSIFSGIHIPTHELLEMLAIEHGFVKYDEEIFRTRRSKDGTLLSQRIIRFKNMKEN